MMTDAASIHGAQGMNGQNSPSLTHFKGVGINLHFQDGPIKKFGVNGTTNEEVIELLIDRINSLNTMLDGMYACPENAMAILYLQSAKGILEKRTAQRVARNVEGTSAV